MACPKLPRPCELTPTPAAPGADPSAALAFLSGHIYVASNFAQDGALFEALSAPLNGTEATGDGTDRGYWLQIGGRSLGRDEDTRDAEQGVLHPQRRRLVGAVAGGHRRFAKAWQVAVAVKSVPSPYERRENSRRGFLK